jgi:hypothetical protein
MKHSLEYSRAMLERITWLYPEPLVICRPKKRSSGVLGQIDVIAGKCRPGVGFSFFMQG